jgi:hypothetical protein
MSNNDEFDVVRTEDMSCKLFPIQMAGSDGPWEFTVGLPSPLATELAAALRNPRTNEAYEIRLSLDLVFHILQHLNDDFELMVINEHRAESN